MLLTLPFKRTFLLFPFIIVVNFARSQSIDLGLRGALTDAWLLNTNFLKAGTEQNYKFTLSDNFGLHAAMNFDQGAAVELDILDGELNQGYSGKFTSSGYFPGNGISYQAGQSYTAKTEISIIRIPVMFRYEKPSSGIYMEAGGGYDIISGVNYSASYTNPSFNVNEDITKQCPVGNFLLMAGLGLDKRFIPKYNFYFSVGFRLTYGLMDLQGVDGHGQDITGVHSIILYEPPNPYYENYHSTHAIDASLNFGIFYRFLPANVHKRVIKF